MLDIGFGEVVVIAILALLVFGPDRLPKVAADAARLLRQVRDMATAARRELTDAAGLDDSGISQAVNDLRDLDPRRALRGNDGSTAARQPQRPAAPSVPVTPPSGGPSPIPPVAGADPDARAVLHPAPAPREVAGPTPVDPDWT